jgi:hypothetical protein
MQHTRRLSRLALVAIAVSLSACSATPYLGAGLTAQDLTFYEFKAATGETTAIRRNPLGRAVAGVEFEPAPTWRINLEVAHTSSVVTNADRGVNTANVMVRWFPLN